MDVRIDRFRAEHAPAFEALNRAWLVDHGLYEGRDEEQLADPWGAIINPGGQIFVALLDNEVVGTCAVLPHGSGVFELAKLVVAPAAQGHGLGRQLVDADVPYATADVFMELDLVASATGMAERTGP